MKTKSVISMLVCIMMLLSLAGCADGDNRGAITPQPYSTPTMPSGSVIDGDNPSAEVVKSVAHYFPTLSGTEIYAAAQYNNTGDCAIVVKSAEFTLDIGGSEITINAVQPAPYAVVYPNEYMYAVAWQPKGEDLVMTSDSDINITVKKVTLDYEKVQSDRIRIEVENATAVKNYNDFSTLNGSVISERDCKINTIFAGFHDSNDELVAVWFFSENSNLSAGAPVRFSSNMQSLPLPDMLLNCKINAFGFGYND